VVTTGDEVRELLETRWERLGYDQLLPVEQDYILVWWLQAEASNGTLHQYFYNSTGDSAAQTLTALERLGAKRAHTILGNAIAAFGVSGYTSNREERIKRLTSIPNQYEVFQGLTDKLFDESEDFISLAIDHVGDAYNERGIEVGHYARASKLRLPSIVLLLLILVFAVVVAVFMIAAA